VLLDDGQKFVFVGELLGEPSSAEMACGLLPSFSWHSPTVAAPAPQASVGARILDNLLVNIPGGFEFALRSSV